MIPIESMPDVEGFVGRIRGERGGCFAPDRPVEIVRAPARLDVMGGIADYTGSLVLTQPLRRAVVMGVQSRDDQHVVVRSLAAGQAPEHSECRWPLAWLYGDGGRPTAPDRLAARVEDAWGWARYVAGVFHAVLVAGVVPHFGGGATVAFESTATPHVGLGTSAALEVATCQALAAHYGFSIDPLHAARICQRAENLVIGAPCGIMDPVTSLVGRAGTLLQLRCQPHEVLGTLDLPGGTTVVGVNSGVAHSTRSPRYIETRTAAFMGHRMILDRLWSESPTKDTTNGYLANVVPEEYVARFRDGLPIKMRGEEFLRRYGSSTDSVTRVDPSVVYKVRSRTEHHIYENRRVHEFVERISRATRTGDRATLCDAGQLMYASHWSYSQRCGLGSVQTDLLCNLIRQAGPNRGFYGAKTSGGGAGGTVVAFMDDAPRTRAALEHIMATYEQRTGLRPELIEGSSPGAVEFGAHRITL